MVRGVVAPAASDADAAVSTRAQAHARVNAAAPNVPTDEVSDEDAEGDVEEGDEEDDGWAPTTKLFRPVFRSKEERATILAAEEEAAAIAAAREAEARLMQQRALESRELVASELRREEAEAAAREAEEEAVGRPDDTDRPDEEEAEYEAWKMREMRRILRDIEAQKAAVEEAAETERRRRMTDEERAAEDKLLEQQGLKVFQKNKSKWKFLQKYYHRGAFYMDEETVKTADDVRKREADGATGEDVFDKSMMPEVMQVKNFGKRGRTRWTHLSAEDTTAHDDYYKTASSYATSKFAPRMAGVHGGVDPLSAGRKRPRESQ